jgi:hypothetical protein
MSGWIDIKLRKPTAADADKEWQDGEVIQRLDDGSTGIFAWDSLAAVVAWMPIPEFTPLPDPPEGFRYVQEQEPFDKRARFWSDLLKKWEITTNTAYDHRLVYIVPIDPPAPTYRPFKDAAEFDPFVLKPWRYLVDVESLRRPPAAYSDKSHNGNDWPRSLAVKIFCDGTPFGVKVE